MNPPQKSVAISTLIAGVIERMGRLYLATDDGSLCIFESTEPRPDGSIQCIICWDPRVFTRLNDTNPRCFQCEVVIHQPDTLLDFLRSHLKRVDEQAFVFEHKLVRVVSADFVCPTIN
jgi:hypothetical protein